MALRQQVVSLYRRVLRLSRTWRAQDGSQTKTEQQFIRKEAQLFKKNKHIQTEEEVRELLKDAEQRIAIALHYQIPYPRPVNFPQHAMPTTALKMRGSSRILKQAKTFAPKSFDERDS